MPSLRKRVSTYFRQLSFNNEPRQNKHNINENAFVTKYLQGNLCLKEGPPIIHGKNPTDLPNYELAKYETGYESIISCYSGPHGGLTTVKRVEKHLSIPDADDFDFIDTQIENVQPTFPINSSNKTPGQPVDNTKMVIKVAGQKYFVKNDTKQHRKSLSLDSISDFNIEIEKTKIDREFYGESDKKNEESKKQNGKQSRDGIIDKDNMEEKCCVKARPCQKEKNAQKKNSGVFEKDSIRYRPSKTRKSLSRTDCQSNRQSTYNTHSQKNVELAKSKSDGNPFKHKGTRKVVERPKCDNATSQSGSNDKSKLPQEWNKKSDYVFGISDSLYDTNLVTKVKNGEPIADCFGVISRKDSVILAVADGVNWGEKACIAAKSAIHGCLHYLNKTIFNDTKLFENLVVMTDQQATSPSIAEPLTHISNTKEVFICLLRAFNCAHDLILENNGMLTTLTVAIVLPLCKDSRLSGAESSREEQKYVCCVCNVGDTLAYVYSGNYGIRELTRGSHDITSNRDMRDALGALGPVDGINPELSNLTLSITTLSKGDIVMVASDGLTDNFDPSVCRFTVNTTKINPVDNKETSSRAQTTEKKESSINNTASTCPTKPPRMSHQNRNDRVSKESKPSMKSDESINNSTNFVKKTIIKKVNESSKKGEDLLNNPLIAHFMKQNSIDEIDVKIKTVQDIPVGKAINTDKKPSSSEVSIRKPLPNQRTQQQNYNFLRSKTTIDFHSTSKKPILRNEEGIPYVTPVQRYELQLLLMEDILKHGISGQESPCTTSKKLCENLVDFTISITAAKRRTLEDMDLYFDNRDGVLVEISPTEKKQRRKKGLEKVLNLPGKLDHVTVVACNIAHLPVNI